MEVWTDNYGIIKFVQHKNHLMMIDMVRKTISACNTKTMECFEKVSGKWTKLANTLAHIDV